ncbi:hypothetical protein AVEN_182409-1 [Araneus ventricosus]|uniref:Uncharacterized protein n=1 Tax=Araneus ventricosus TaxID=182803 RepID=A0A4Y2SYP7_ARAVE|nr:hypothetical protein AVEN_182409-1 [Araneus ventricosus]
MWKSLQEHELEHLKSLEHRNAMYKDYAFEIENYDELNEENTNRNPWLPVHKFRLLITGESGKSKTMVELSIINKLMDNFDALYVCGKSIREPKYQKLIEDCKDLEKEDIEKEILNSKKMSKKD